MTRKPKRLKTIGSVLLGTWARGKVTNLVTVVVALSLAMVTPALAATGGNFILGKANTATDPSGTATGITQLTAKIANPAMKLINTSTAAGATALNLTTASDKPPMTVNSQTKVDNLNADSVDGNDSTAFAPGTNGKANDADKLDGLDPSQLPGTMAAVGSFSGPIGDIPAGNAFVFAGPTTTVTTSANQRLVGSAQALLSLSSGGPLSFDYHICRQPDAGGTIVPFTTFLTAEVDTTLVSYSANSSVVPGAGTWKVGLCYKNSRSGGSAIDHNDWSSGWVQVINESPTTAASSLTAENIQEDDK